MDIRQRKEESILFKLLFPLNARFPVEILAVAVLAITAFIAYTAIQPELDEKTGLEINLDQVRETYQTSEKGITLFVENENNTLTVADIEKAVVESGGIVIRRESTEDREIVVASIDYKKLKALEGGLGRAGKIRDKAVNLDKHEGTVQVYIITGSFQNK